MRQQQVNESCVKEAKLQQYVDGEVLPAVIPASKLWEGRTVAILVIRRPA